VERSVSRLVEVDVGWSHSWTDVEAGMSDATKNAAEEVMENVDAVATCGEEESETEIVFATNVCMVANEDEDDNTR